MDKKQKKAPGNGKAQQAREPPKMNPLQKFPYKLWDLLDECTRLNDGAIK